MKKLTRPWLLVLLLAAPSHLAHAQDAVAKPEAAAYTPPPVEKPEEAIKDPSPDGRVAFLEIAVPEYRREGTVDLIEQKSKKVLLRVVDEIDVSWGVDWAPDSQRFVVTLRPGHAIQGIDVYVRHGQTFRRVELPALTADVPKRLTRHKSFPHFASLNYQSGAEWTGNRTLKLNICTMMDGAADTVSATRDVVLGFDHADKARILKSTIKYESEHDESYRE